MGRREDKNLATRQQLLTAAATLFAQHGYEATSIEGVAEKANLSKGTFYYHFQSKEDLVVELRRSILSGTLDEAMALASQGQPPLAVLEKLLLGRAAFTEKEPELSRVFYEQKIQHFFFKEDDSRVRAAVKEDGRPRRRFPRAIYELICEAQKLGAIRSDLSPQEITGMILAFFLHAHGSWLSSDRTTSLVQQVQRWLHALLDGIGSKGYRENTLV